MAGEIVLARIALCGRSQGEEERERGTGGERSHARAGRERAQTRTRTLCCTRCLDRGDTHTACAHGSSVRAGARARGGAAREEPEVTGRARPVDRAPVGVIEHALVHIMGRRTVLMCVNFLVCARAAGAQPRPAEPKTGAWPEEGPPVPRRAHGDPRPRTGGLAGGASPTRQTAPERCSCRGPSSHPPAAPLRRTPPPGHQVRERSCLRASTGLRQDWGRPKSD
jgi:hypothetical protein